LGSIGVLVVRQTKRRLAFVGPFLCFVSLGKQRNEGEISFFLSQLKKFKAKKNLIQINE
jgi:hypothetical protein